MGLSRNHTSTLLHTLFKWTTRPYLCCIWVCMYVCMMYVFMSFYRLLWSYIITSYLCQNAQIGTFNSCFYFFVAWTTKDIQRFPSFFDRGKYVVLGIPNRSGFLLFYWKIFLYIGEWCQYRFYFLIRRQFISCIWKWVYAMVLCYFISNWFSAFCFSFQLVIILLFLRIGSKSIQSTRIETFISRVKVMQVIAVFSAFGIGLVV